MNAPVQQRGWPVGTPAGVLLVDDEAVMRRFLRRHFEARGWACWEAENGRDALTALESGLRIHLIITDIAMPQMTGIELLRRLRACNRRTPVIVLSGYDEVAMAVEAMRLSAADYLVKPCGPGEVEEAVQRVFSTERSAAVPAAFGAAPDDFGKHLVEMDSSIRAADIALMTLSSSLGTREEETRRHSVRVAYYALRLAREIGLPQDWLDDVSSGALIHDIGKLGLADSILLKPGPLTLDERAHIQQHPEIGRKLVQEIPALRHLSQIVQCHHERFDGHGYPNGIKGYDIPLGSRIISVVDSYDSLTSSRPYRETASYAAAAQELRRCSGTQFDPDLVEAFCRIDPAEIEQLRALACERLTKPDAAAAPGMGLPAYEMPPRDGRLQPAASPMSGNPFSA